MGIGISILLIAAGAVLIWAVNASVRSVELVTIGWILLVIGAAGLLISLLVWPARTARRRDERPIVDR